MTVNDTIRELLSSEKIAFLVGAGISIPSPSNLPSGRSFIEAVVPRISPTKQIADELILLSEAERQDRRNRGDFIRFEGLMQTIRESIDQDLEVLAFIADCFYPNQNHFVLAHLLQRGYPVLTTNFDSLIELASETLRLSQKVYISEKDFNEYSSSSQHPSLLKLHGSFRRLEEGEWKTSVESIKATLEAVGTGGGKLLFEPNKRRVVSEVLQEFDLVILGYSGYDDFDISPLVRAIESQKRIIWINHSDVPKEFSWKEIENADRDVNGDFLRKRDEVLYGLGAPKFGAPLREIKHIHMFDYDTAKIIDMLAKKHGFTIPQVPGTFDYNLERFFDYWAEKYIAGDCQRYAVCAGLFSSLQRHVQALQCSQSGLQIAENLKDLVFQRVFLNNIGVTQMNSGDFDGARLIFDKVEVLGDRMREGGFEVFQNCSSDETLELIEQIIDYNRKAEFARKIKPGMKFEKLGSISFEEGDLENALRQFGESLKVFRKAECQDKEATALYNLGRTYHMMGVYNEALRALRQSESLARQVGDLRLVAYCANVMGMVHRSLGKLEKALDEFRRSMTISENLGAEEALATSLLNIGIVYQKMGDFERAKNAHLKSAAKAEMIDDSHKVSCNLHELGIIYSDEGDLERALQIHLERLAISKKEARKVDVVLSLYEIGFVQKNLGNHHEALKSFEESLAQAREMKMLPCVALGLLQIGDIRLWLKDYEAARKFLLEAATLMEEMKDPRVSITLDLLHKAEKDCKS